jgi:anti-sigma factor RsiW
MSWEAEVPSLDVHSEAWWIRLMDDELTAVERARWDAHLRQCPRCQSQWEAMTHVDDLLRSAPVPQILSVGFTAETVDKVMQRQRLRRLLAFTVGTIIVMLVTLLVLTYVGSTLGAVERSLGAAVAARQTLFRSATNLVLALFFGWRAMLPFVLALCAVGYVLLLPNGFLFTAALIWLSGHRRAVVPVRA